MDYTKSNFLPMKSGYSSMKSGHSSKIIENNWPDPIIIQSFVGHNGLFVEEIPLFVDEKHGFIMKPL